MQLRHNKRNVNEKSTMLLEGLVTLKDSYTLQWSLSIIPRPLLSSHMTYDMSPFTSTTALQR